MAKPKKKSTAKTDAAPKERRTTMDTVHSVMGRHRGSAAPAAMTPGDARPGPQLQPVSLARADSAAPTQQADGWQNVLTGLGMSGIDKRQTTEFKTSPILSPADLRDIYRGNGMGKRIVELPTREMMRRGFDLKGDDDRIVMGIFESRKIHKQVANMIRWSRLFGGSVGVMGIQDGGLLEMPVNENAIKKLEFLHVFDSERVFWTHTDLYTDPRNPKYNTPKWYNINPLLGNPFRVHESRVLVMDGVPVDDQSRIENRGWGDSVLQCAFEELRALGSVYSGTEIIIDDFITGVLAIKNLSDILQSGNWSFLKERLNGMDLSKHMLNTMLIDGQYETYEKKASSVAGLPDLIDRFAQALSAVTGIPQTLLMGRSPAGMNANGESDTRGWYDQVAQDQRDLLNPIYERLIYLTFISKEVGGEPEDWEIDWLPLWEPSQKEEAETNKLDAETLDIYHQAGAMGDEEVRDQIRDLYKLEGDTTPDNSAADKQAAAEAAAEAAAAAAAKDGKKKTAAGKDKRA